MADPESLLTSPAFVEVLRALGLTSLDEDAFQMLEDARQQVMIGEISVDEYDALKQSVEVQLKQAALELAMMHQPRQPTAAQTAQQHLQGTANAAMKSGMSAVRTLGSYVSGLTKAATAPTDEKPILESELLKAPITQHFASIGQKTFKKRYVVLFKNCICYYANKGDLAPKGRVDLSPDFFIQDSNAHVNGFVVSDMNVTMTFGAESAELKGYWMHMVANVLRKLKESANHDNNNVNVPAHSADDLKDIYDQKLEEYKKSKNNRRKSFFFRKKKEQEEEIIKKAGEVAVKQTYEELKSLEKKRQKELEDLNARLVNAEEEAEKFKTEADMERERAEKEMARAEEEMKKREEAEARAGMSMEQWQAEARARELELQRERDEIREMLEKSNMKRRQTMVPGAAVSSDEIERLEKERKALQAKLDALSKALDLDMGSLEWDGTLDDAETKMKALVPMLCSENEKEAREAQVQFDQWDKIIRNHADYKKREEQKWVKWEEDQKEANLKALAEMKKIVPFEVTTGVDQDFLTKRGLTVPVAQRVMKTKIFLFLYMEKDKIAKTHIADLSTRYVIQGLDIVEMRAIYVCLPDEFLLDADGKKALWKETFRAKLHQMTQKEKDGSLAKNDARQAAYRPPEAAPAKGAGGGGGPAGGGPRGPSPAAGALAGLFGARGPPGGPRGPPGGPGGAPNPLAAMLAARGPLGGPRGPPGGGDAPGGGAPNPIAALFAGRGGPGGPRGPPPAVVQQSAESSTPEKPAAAALPPPAPAPAAAKAASPKQVTIDLPTPQKKNSTAAASPPKKESTAPARPAAESTAGVAIGAGAPRAAAGSTTGSSLGTGPRVASMSASGTKKGAELAARFEQAQKEKVAEAKKRQSRVDLGYSFNKPGADGGDGGSPAAAGGGGLLSKDAQDLLDKMRQGGDGGTFEGEVKTYDFLGAAEQRQKKAAWVDDGIVKVAEIIKIHGKKDAKEGGIATMKFGELFNKYGEGSDMLVGILMRGKKQKKVKYTGDMLFKDVHDNVNITLL